MAAAAVRGPWGQPLALAPGGPLLHLQGRTLLQGCRACQLGPGLAAVEVVLKAATVSQHRRMRCARLPAT